jgi:hypothetical protein
VHGHAGEELRRAKRERCRKRAARGEPGDVNAAPIDRYFMHHSGDLGRDDRRFAGAARGARVEPVPAALRVCEPVLARKQHEEAAVVRERRDAAAGGERFGILLAAVQPDDERRAPARVVAARQVEQVVAPRGRRGNADETVQAGTLAEREAAGRGRRSPEQPLQEAGGPAPGAHRSASSSPG